MKKYSLLALALLIAGCGVESDPGGPPMRNSDKHLSCEELMLELNEARFLQAQAKENRGLNFRNIVWPVGYPSTVSSAAEAIDVTDKRIAYLTNIYNIRNCSDPYPESR